MRHMKILDDWLARVSDGRHHPVLKFEFWPSGGEWYHDW
jgi:hypothetical protein